MAICPQCGTSVGLQAERCSKCIALFNGQGGWRPVPDTPEEVAAWHQLHPDCPPGTSTPRSGSRWRSFFFFVWTMGLGAGYGVAAHVVFGRIFSHAGQGRSGLMLASFLIGVPFVIAVLWAALRAHAGGTGIVEAMAGSSIPILLFVFIAGAFLREGFICVLMALPLFIGVGLVGSAIGWAATVASRDKSPKLLGVAVFVPFLLGSLEDQTPPTDAVRVVTADIHIQAPPAKVWTHINFPLAIQAEELSRGWAYRMGVPYPLEARTLEPKVGGLRELRWERGVKFQEVITQYDEGRAIAWRYRFAPDSFPTGSLDDHIVIGGRYFDLQDTGYELKPVLTR